MKFNSGSINLAALIIFVGGDTYESVEMSYQLLP